MDENEEPTIAELPPAVSTAAPPPAPVPVAKFEAQSVNLHGVRLKIAASGVADDDVFIDQGPLHVTVYVGAAARLARLKRVEALLAELAGEPAPVQPLPRTQRPAVAAQRTAARQPQPTDDPDWVPPPVVPSAAEQRRAEAAAVAEGRAVVDDDDEAGDAEDPLPVSRTSRAPKSPIDRTFAQRQALRPTVQIGNSTEQIDLTGVKG